MLEIRSDEPDLIQLKMGSEDGEVSWIFDTLQEAIATARALSDPEVGRDWTWFEIHELRSTYFASGDTQDAQGLKI